MTSRRHFIQQTAFAGAAFTMPGAFSFLMKDGEFFSYESPYLKLQLSKKQPSFSFFSTDSLGGRSFPVNLLLPDQGTFDQEYETAATTDSISYFPKGEKQHPIWTFSLQPRSMAIRTRYTGKDQPPLTISFSQRTNHCTVLGAMKEEKQITFPCVLHFPGMGTFRMYCSEPSVMLFYDADRNVKDPFVRIALQAADAQHPDITYRFESATIYPDSKKIREDARFDGFRRNYINIFQVNPRIRALANNSASDACAFTLYLYTEMARHTPELVKGLHAMDLVRNSLDQYVAGMKAYGQVGYKGGAAWQSEYDSSDSAPSLIMSACYYILDTNDNEWAKQNYHTVKAWAAKMIATDTNKDGIIEYGYSGNSDSWDNQHFRRPANWWDTIGFGHDDAYSNALAYRACVLLAQVAKKLGKADDSLYFNTFAGKLKSNYYSTFYNPASGVLAGWKSEDGQLHDYYFTFVNSIAVCYDLVKKEDGRRIMQALLNKMKEVGYTDFRLGLSGNLISVADKDYAHHDPRWGYQKFQVYENGGATGCYVYYTIHALYLLGMRKEAEAILMPMLESYKAGSFEGNCPGSSMTKDWKTWTGECWGYEGFLVDNYLALLAVKDYTG